MSTIAADGALSLTELPTADAAEAALHHRQRWWILGVVALAQLMVVLDSTVVNIALPSAQRALSFNDSDRQWIVTSYALAFGSLLLLGGRLADLFGRKRIFVIGLIGFAAASAIGGAANGFGVLVTARAVQGVFGALLAPAALSLLSTAFAEFDERAKAFGIFGAVAGSGAAIGLLLGGVLTEYASWRWCMFINVIFAGVALIGALTFLGGHHNVRRRVPLDVPGTVLVSSGLFSVVYGFAHAENHGWANAVTLGFITVGVALVAGFVLVEARVAQPLLPLRVVLDRNRGGSYLAMFAVGIGMFAMFLFLTFYLQQSLGMSAVRSGLAYLPMVAILMVVSQVATIFLAHRVGPRWIIAPGMLVAAVGLAMLTRLDSSSGYAGGVLPATLVFGAGLGLLFASALSTATSGVHVDDAGVASALVNTGQQIGGSIGTALLSTLAATATRNYGHAHSSASVSVVARAAAIHGYTTAFGCAAVVFAVGGVATAVILRGKRVIVDEDASEE